jgi:hypothetical protein
VAKEESESTGSGLIQRIRYEAEPGEMKKRKVDTGRREEAR